MPLFISGDFTIFDLPVTLTFYSVASALSLCLCMVLLFFAWFQPGTLVIRNWALSVLVLSTGFFVSGVGPELPVWATVIGTNVVLLSSGPIIYSGFFAFFKERRVTFDRWGWAMVALTVPAFWYWGLIEPNGNYRSMAFSLAAAVINSRTALLLGDNAIRRAGGIPTRVMAALFSILTVWMTARFVVLLLSDPAPPELRGANPTGWMTVFGYIVLMSLMSVCVMWMEANRLKERQTEVVRHVGRLSVFIEYFRNKLLLLWSSVTVLIVSVVCMLGIGYVNLRDVEKTRLTRTANLVNDAFTEHTLQAASQIDTILRSVRGFYLRTHSIPETASFINALGFDRSVVDNIYLIDSDGRVVLSHDPATPGRSVTDREYFSFHRVTATDQIFISSVEPGRVTGKFHFRITRRIDNPDGSFGGLVLATVNPEFFARYYRDLSTGSKSFASLLGLSDRKLRARVPAPPLEQWAKPVESPLWEALRTASSGHYENISPIDTVRRLYVYKKVGTLPLVMVTGFSNDDLKQGVSERMSLLVITSLGTLAFAILLALLLSIEAKRREEHWQAETALRKNEQRLRDAQAIGKIGNWELDVATGILTFSDEMFVLLERVPENNRLPLDEALLGFRSEDRPIVQEYFRNAIETGTGWEHEVRMTQADGQEVWHRGVGTAVRDSSGTVFKVYGTTQDITKSKLTEEALRKSEQRLRDAQTIGKIGDWELDLTTGKMTYSDQLYEMSGRTPETMPYTISETLLAYHPDDVSDVERALRQCIEKATEEQVDARHIAPDGSVKWFRYTGKSLRNTQGTAVKIYGTTQDINSDKMMELELKNLNETLQQRVEKETESRIASERLLIQRSKQADMGEMIGAIAHQWRQPLSTVGVIFQNLLAARRMNKLDEAYLEKAATDATALITHMSKTIDSFRNFFKPEKSKERFNVIEKIEDAVAFIQGQLKILDIRIVLPEYTDQDCTITGFPNEFAQVILNLFANSRDAILENRLKNGGGADVIVVTVQSENRHLVIQVTDSGCGIAPDAALRVFEPYFTTKEEGHGTGIGLYMSQQIITESMGGTLTFTSKPGETVFRIEVPHV